MRREKRILVVDDDNAIRALLATVLRRRGFQVDTARHGADAVQRFSSCRYALVLLDLMMPVMNGYEFLQHVEAMPAPDRPLVVVLTAGTEPRSLNPHVVAAALRKPFDIETVVETALACLASVEERDQFDDCSGDPAPLRANSDWRSRN